MMNKFMLSIGALWAVLLAPSQVSASELSISSPIYAEGRIYKAADGDTIRINLPEKSFSQFQRVDYPRAIEHMNDRYRSILVRLGGVNAKESVHYDSRKNTKEGRDASGFMKSIATNGRPVLLACWDVGDKGRPICSVQLKAFSEPEQGDLGALLIKAGYSEYVTYWGEHPFHHDLYKQLDN